MVTNTPYPLVGCLNSCESVIQADPSTRALWKGWQPINSKQKELIKDLEASRADLAKLGKDLECLASFNHMDLIQFAEKRGFAIHIKPFDSDSFGAISVLNINIKWLTPGKIRSLQFSSGWFGSSKLYKGFELSKVIVYKNGIVQVPTQNGDLVRFQMTSKMVDLSKVSLGERDDTDRVILPYVCLEDHPNLDWLLRLKGADYRIEKAVQITRFMMDPEGASVKSMAAVEMTRSLPIYHEPIVFNKPFSVTITRPGLKLPLFVGYITHDALIASEPLRVEYSQIPPHHSTNLVNWRTIDQAVVDEIKSLLTSKFQMLKAYDQFKLRRTYDSDYIDSLYSRKSDNIALPSNPGHSSTMEVISQDKRVGLIIFSTAGDVTLMM